MKTTIELDEKKLERIMKLSGIKTRKEAVDFALKETERTLRMRTLTNKKLYFNSGPVIDPKYDLEKIRNKELF
jgi:hypothetical protein